MKNKEFASLVYATVRKIPKGSVVTYQVIAKAIGRPLASRAVGRVLNVNPNLLSTPCHRVISSSGRLGGYVHGVDRKRDLLLFEGVKIVRGIVHPDCVLNEI